MNLLKHGDNISLDLNITPNGIWLLVKEHEYFLPYEEYPWFLNASVKEIYQVELQYDKYLHWPKLDIDLAIDGLKNPQNYPLIYKSN